MPIHVTSRTRSTLLGLLFVGVLLGAVMFAYWPAFHGGRIWDDHFLVGRNPFFRSPVLVLEAFRHWLYPFSDASYFRPVQNASYMVDYFFWSTDLFGYHLTNALLHAAAALALAILIRRIANTLAPGNSGRNSTLAAGVSIVWLVHPIHHAAVAYTSGRADSLAAVFAIFGWLLADNGMEARTRRSRTGFFAAAVLCCVSALCSKEIAITWIALFAIYQLAVRPGRPGGLRIATVSGACGMVVIYCLYRQTLPHSGEVIPVSGGSPILMRGVQAMRALGDYLSIVLLPTNLHMERQLHIPTEALRASNAWLYYHSITLIPLGIASCVAALWLCFSRSDDRRLNVFALCWFLVGFVPISNLFPLNAPVAEHWIYMPSAALILLILKCMFEVTGTNRMVRHVAVGMVALVLVSLTNLQSRTWLDEETMFRTAISRGGDTARAYANLARALDARGDSATAEAMLRRALIREPENPTLTVQLTSVLERSGRSKDALEMIRKKDSAGAVERARPPIPWVLETQKIRLLLLENNLLEGQIVLDQALNRWPHAWELVSLQALLSAKAGEVERSVDVLGGYVQKNWWHRAAVLRLAQYLAQLRHFDDAVEKYRLAGRLDVHDAKPWEQISAIRFAQGRLTEALTAQEKAVRVEPQSVEQRRRLAAMYFAAGNEVDALVEKQIADELEQRS